VAELELDTTVTKMSRERLHTEANPAATRILSLKSSSRPFVVGIVVVITDVFQITTKN
jgi:hypothetical protein